MFTNTKAALAYYDFTAPLRYKMLRDATTNAAIIAWADHDAEAVKGVQRAFYEDTKDRNSLEHCKEVSIQHARLCVGVYGG